MTRLALAALVLAACGGDDGHNHVQTDAAVQVDAAAKVTALATCPATVDATMTTNAAAFSPTGVTVSVGAVVKLEATVGHKIIPNTLQPSDSALNVAQGATKCFKFNATGSYSIICEFHSFVGAITVN
jgi:plastocyanin